MLHAHLTRQNPWWRQDAEAAVNADPKIHSVKEAHIQWVPHVLPFNFSQDLVYIMRGLRQVGKSTLLKLCVQKLLDAGRNPRKICYVDVESAGVASYSDLLELLRGYLDWIGNTTAAVSENERIAILLDEVTIEANWSTAIRVLYDEGRLKNVTLLATGSNAGDLAAGGDRLPNRRGKGTDLDWILNPLSFRDYLQLTEPSLTSAIDQLDITDRFLPDSVGHVLQEVQLHHDVLVAHFHKYLVTGGFLFAINEEIEHGYVPPYVYDTYRAAIIGEVTRLGRREDMMRPIVFWLDKHLGQEFDWVQMSKDTGAGTHTTMRDLVTVIERAFVWHVYWRLSKLDTNSACSPALRSPKKLYPSDPLTWHTLSAWSKGYSSVWDLTLETLSDSVKTEVLVESVIADHLRRIAGTYSYYYRNKDGQEIDFVICNNGNPAANIEVKYRTNVAAKDRRALKEAGGGFLLTKSSYGVHKNENGGAVVELPAAAALLLWNGGTLTKAGF